MSGWNRDAGGSRDLLVVEGELRGRRKLGQLLHGEDRRATHGVHNVGMFFAETVMTLPRVRQTTVTISDPGRTRSRWTSATTSLPPDRWCTGGRAAHEPMGGPVVATVRVETDISVPAQRVWDAIADIGAVHQRLLPGRVVHARIEGDTRILAMPDGSEIRELILSVDYSLRRLAYAVVEGQRLPLSYHHAAFQVIAQGDHSRLVWLTDILPHTMAAAIQARVERGILEIKQTLESAEADRQ